MKTSELDGLVILVNNVSLTISDFVTIDEENLNHEFTRQASLLAYVSHMMVMAEHKYNQLKATREIAQAEADAYYREELDKKSVKYTEAKIKSMVTIDEECQIAIETEAEALVEYKHLKVLAEAVKERGAMLISLGAMLRAEADLTGQTIKQTMQDYRQRNS